LEGLADMNISDVLQSLGILLVVIGITFADDRLISYSFMGAGIILSIISLIMRRTKARASQLLK
jgi:hypothetical protein